MKYVFMLVASVMVLVVESALIPGANWWQALCMGATAGMFGTVYVNSLLDMPHNASLSGRGDAHTTK